MKNNVSEFENYTLAHYQEDAVKKLLHYSNFLIGESDLEGTNILLLQAITGAGKTIMMGDYLKKMFDAYGDVAFIWVSIGNGELVEQSSKKVKELRNNPVGFMCWDCEKVLTDIATPKEDFEKMPISMDGYLMVICKECAKSDE